MRAAVLCLVLCSAGSASAALRATLELDKNVIMIGEPIYIRLVVHNPSAQDLQTTEGGNQRNHLGRFDDYKVVVVDEKGQALPVPSSAPSFGGITWAPKIPARGAHTQELFLPNWVTFTRPGRYTITCSRSFKIRRFARDDWFGEGGREVRLSARARITVTPADPKRMGELIDRLGKGMLGRHSDVKDRAIRKLGVIDDARVIPWYVRAIRSRRYELKFAGVTQLAKFNNDAALEGIKLAIKSSARDFDDATTAKIAASLADNIRQAVANSLSESKHPRAWGLLLSMRTDPYSSIRLTVLHALAKRNTRADRVLIEKMTADRSKMVRDEARRYLGTR
jgi:hypothetical protein